jgi:hypothetical protein
MFDMLVDFVEVEKAWINVVFTNRKPWSGWGRTYWWRSRNEGPAYLEWEIGLGDPNLPVEERHEQQAKFFRRLFPFLLANIFINW